MHRELPDGELMVYDAERHRAHSLNRAAAFVWQQCDGRTSVADLTARLARLGLPADEELVWLALARLEKAHLLQEPLHAHPAPISRRALVRKLGLAGGLTLLLPVVTSLAAPQPALAQSGTGGFVCCLYHCTSGGFFNTCGIPCQTAYPNPQTGCPFVSSSTVTDCARECSQT